ncbi:hypothetical protein F5J12DRAFT_789543 [Pisolithus orientalis]|uniref:uncharacterized protein n=1 Tax=Pisolithus orientalis TaxID=936130 RepID=UPI0022252E2B|nr:uncharacterized protein F5J12DRAFT_789543 [Pisolithus orientalis]KAI6034862.1 hypothetical protein F5J12DRAFT_789543 [Pisolithus orientalis]
MTELLSTACILVSIVTTSFMTLRICWSSLERTMKVGILKRRSLRVWRGWSSQSGCQRAQGCNQRRRDFES